MSAPFFVSETLVATESNFHRSILPSNLSHKRSFPNACQRWRWGLVIGCISLFQVFSRCLVHRRASGTVPAMSRHQ